MGAIIKINPVATADLQEIKNYIAEESKDIALKVVKEIVEKVEKLSQFSEMVAKLQNKIRLKSKYR